MSSVVDGEPAVRQNVDSDSLFLSFSGCNAANPETTPSGPDGGPDDLDSLPP
jgi:hypothetical protein